jgi:2-keto-4-pentenoate hydratase/2-oxohepta-3-ene-1,7-dioic acid hydratase in catechol pathway
MLCLGKNYEKHAREMGGEVPADPVVFMKPATALVRSGGTVQIPRVSKEMHHELELVVVIGETARDVGEDVALDCVLGYAVGLDMTLRDLQAKAKQRGEPWTIAKGFDSSAPISEVVPRELVADPHALSLRLAVNGETRQHGSTGDMILGVPRIISYLSSIFTLERGDCIFTGTPEGVGQVIAGDRLYAEIEGLVSLEVTVSDRG